MNSYIKLALFIAFIVILDQLTKLTMVSFFANNPYGQIEILPVLKLVLMWNKGISFGVLSNFQDANLLLCFSSGSIILFLTIWLARTRESCTRFALSLIIGGAIGNVIDRVHHGAVVDFLYFHWNSYYFPAFNVADSSIFCGVVILILLISKEESKNV